MKKIKELLLIILLAIGIYSCAPSLSSQIADYVGDQPVKLIKLEGHPDRTCTIVWQRKDQSVIESVVPQRLLSYQMGLDYLHHIIFVYKITPESSNRFLSGTEKKEMLLKHLEDVVDSVRLVE